MSTGVFLVLVCLVLVAGYILIGWSFEVTIRNIEKRITALNTELAATKRYVSDLSEIMKAIAKDLDEKRG